MKLTIQGATCFLLVLVFSGAGAFAEHVGGQLTASVPIIHHPVQSGSTLPASLRLALYRVLAKGAGAAYNLNGKGCVTLPRQTLEGCFGIDGAHFVGAGSPLTLRLVAFGRGEARSPLKAVAPAFVANRVNYVHGNLSEWWRVLPVGFEQGFTVTKRPSGSGALIFALTQSKKAGRHDGTLTWGGLRYGGLVVTDAKGQVVPATLKTRGHRILIAVNDAHAAYPLTVDPLVWIEQAVTASDGAAISAFGNAVAVEGTTALIGAPDVNGSEGAVYAFTYANGTWTQTQIFFASDGVSGNGANFGATIALDGTTALIGAVGATVNGNGAQGAAYVFTESNGTWSQMAKLTASDGTANNYFGQGVAIEGTTALVSAYGAENLQGEAYVFTESNGTWTQTQILTANDGAAGDFFGQSVALSGTVALIGAYAETINGNAAQGAAYIFTYSNGSWSQTQKLVASDGTFGADFGYSVALSGSTALIGAGGATVHNNFGQGTAYVFSESGGSWSQTQELTASDGAAGDDFGYAVALSGTTALIGADRHTVSGNTNQGAAYEFAESDDTWTQTGEFVASDGATGDFFGAAVAVEDTIALVGAPIKTVHGNTLQGEAYFYGGSDLGLAVSAPQMVGQGQQYTSQTIATNNASAASPAVSATITVPAAASFISATATQGSCSEASGVVTCDFGQILGNAGTATANVTLKATGSSGTTIYNTASISKATPALTASAPTQITSSQSCPAGYTTYSGTLAANAGVRGPSYEAPAGEENAILYAPAGFKLYARVDNSEWGGQRQRGFPGTEVHRWGPAGIYAWGVKAGDTAGAFTFCLMHP